MEERRRFRVGVSAACFALNAVEALIRLPRIRQYGSQRWSGRDDRVDGLLVGALGVNLVAAPVLYASGRLARFDYPVNDTGRRLLAGAGLALQVAGVWLFHRSHADLGRNWSPFVESRADQHLVTDGVYQHVRHPMYASQILLDAGQACLLQNAIAGPAGVLLFLSLYLRRVGREEAAMRARFGADWDAHQARTGRLVPRCRSLLRSAPAVRRR